MISSRFLNNIVSILLIIICCSGTNPTQKRDIESSILLEITMQLAGIVDGKVKVGEEVFSTEIFQLKDIIAYRVPIFTDSSLVTLNKEGEFLSEKALGIDTIYKYFLFHKDKKTGLEFNPAFQPAKTTPFNVDSLTKSYGFNILNLNGYHLRPLISPETQQHEIYDINTKKLNEPDQILLEYDRSYRDINYYSFSHKLDSLKQSKLTQIKLVTNENKNVPKMETTLKIIRLPSRPKVTAELQSVLAKTEGKF